MLDFQSKFKIRRSCKEDIEPHEVFLDKLSSKKDEDSCEGKMEVPLSRTILRGFLFLVVLLFLGILAKTFQFQVLEKEKYSALAEENKYIFHSVKADRGVVYDAKGEQIVFNEPGFDLVFDRKIKAPDSSFESLAESTDLETEEIKRIIEEGEEEVVILENLDQRTLIVLETKMDELPGFEIKRRAVREYKDGEVFSHVIGYMGRITEEDLKREGYSLLDFTGRSGLEKSYEEELRKRPGSLRMERNAVGNIISKEVVSFAESGKSLKLWLEADLQRKIYESLSKKLEEIGAEKGVAVALNPQNGGVMSLVSIPGFDNNLFSNTKENLDKITGLLSDEDNPLFNRVLGGQYATGSTIKPLMAAAALEEGIISAEKPVSCTGKITIPHRYDPEIVYEYKDWSVHGATNLRKAIAESCNVYFYTIGGGYQDQEGLGPSRIKKYLERFNWSEKTGIDIPGEEKGFIPSPQWKKEAKGENWWDGDTYNLSIGQGDIAVTPLQVAVSFSAIANKGTLYKPKLVREVISDDQSEEIGAVILKKNIAKQETLEAVREGMRMAVTGAGAPQASSIVLNSLPVAAAAKTGTAQTPLTNHYHNWVTVFAPYENPEIVLTVMIENVKDVQAAVLPVAREVLNYYFQNHD